MSEEKNRVERYEIEEDLYAVDSSGSASEGERMKRLADKFSREVEESFDPDELRDPDAEDPSEE